jgi:hypothetical protein
MLDTEDMAIFVRMVERPWRDPARQRAPGGADRLGLGGWQRTAQDKKRPSSLLCPGQNRDAQKVSAETGLAAFGEES